METDIKSCSIYIPFGVCQTGFLCYIINIHVVIGKLAYSFSRKGLNMGVNIQINVKGASKKISKLQYDYKFRAGEEITIQEFLDETVSITYNRYRMVVSDKQNLETDNQDFIDDKSDKLIQFIKVLSSEEIESKAETGKVDFGIHYNSKLVSIDKAKENARQCFLDGLVAVFIDGERYESLEDIVSLNEDTEVAFVKMVFLAGRMW